MSTFSRATARDCRMNQKKERPTAQQPKQVAQALVARLKVKGDEHALAVLEQMARLLGREVSEKSPDK